MNDNPAIEQLKELCAQISRTLMQIHPLVPRLNDPPTQAEVLKASYELTKQVEVIKKHLLKLQKRDDSTAL